METINFRSITIMTILFGTIIGLLFAINSCRDDESLEFSDYESLVVLMEENGINNDGYLKATFDAVGIQCLGCTFNISGGVFPIDSARGIGNFIQYHVIDTRYAFKVWITFFTGNDAVFFACDYIPESNPCLGLEQIVFLERLVKVGIIDANNNIAIFEPEGYIGTREKGNIQLVIDGEIFSISDPAIQFLIPDR